jgi:hypothetical protein
MAGSSRLVFAVLDAFPHDCVSAEWTPTLWSLAEEGGWARDGGRSILAASTYPNHATFITGADPNRHLVYTNQALRDGELRSAWEVGPATSTLFQECRAAGKRSIGVFGDQNLVGVCGASEADAHWPPRGVLPQDAARGELGYGADRAVIAALDAMDLAETEFVFLQLDEVDTARHLRGPLGDAVLEQCRATDAALGEILSRFRSRWAETLVIVVSDHDHEVVNPGAVDLAAEVEARGLDLKVDHEGTAALVVGEIAEEQLLEWPGVADSSVLSPGVRLVWGAPGQQFGTDWGLAAHHGSPRTMKQLAVVGGGHPAAGQLAKEIEASSPRATLWGERARTFLALPRPA